MEQIRPCPHKILRLYIFLYFSYILVVTSSYLLKRGAVWLLKLTVYITINQSNKHIVGNFTQHFAFCPSGTRADYCDLNARRRDSVDIM